MQLKYRFIKQRITYTGRELSSHWIYKNFNLQGDALVSFIGPAEVKEYLVDMVDRREKKIIRSRLMLHFMAEHFDPDLEKTILRQRLFIGLLAESINELAKKNIIERRGNDLYSRGRKLSVAIATLTPVSTIFHVGLNILSAGTPVKAIGLKDLSISPTVLALKALKLYGRELRAVELSRVKVRAVGPTDTYF
jgi:hypothetical protein